MPNEYIRKMIVDNGLRYWEVAKSLGISDGNFSRKLRVEFSEEEKKQIATSIEKLIKNKKGGE